MTECTRCARKTDLYLCSTCTGDLRKMLHELPWWIARLIETEIGQTRMGDLGRKSKRRDVLHGDDDLAAHIEPFPRDSDQPATDKDRRARQKMALRHALATGRINGRASEELQRVHNTLAWWIKDICTMRGAELPQLHTAAGMARWLKNHCDAAAHQEDGMNLIADIEEVQKSIARVVNRPVAPLVIGPCVTDPAPDELLDKRVRAGDTSTRCNFRLEVGQKTNSVKCPQCEQTHDVAEVLARNMDEADHMLVTVRDLVDRVLPILNEHASQRAVERWIVKGWVEVRGHDASGANMVRIGDVREARRKYARHAKSGKSSA